MSSFKNNIALVGLVFLIVCIGVLLPVTQVNDGINKEGFALLEPGMYPLSVDSPLLSDTYDVKQNPGYDNMSAADIFVNALIIFRDFPEVLKTISKSFEVRMLFSCLE